VVRAVVKFGGTQEPELVPAPLRVVIVEDHAMVAQALAAVLAEEPDIDVVAVANTATAAPDVVREAAADTPGTSRTNIPRVPRHFTIRASGRGGGATWFRGVGRAPPERRRVVRFSRAFEAELRLDDHATACLCGGTRLRRSGQVERVSIRAADTDADESPTLQSRLEVVAEDAGGDAEAPSATTDPAIADPVALFRHLEDSGRFHRDTGFGRIFHPGSISFRESSPTDSLHITIRDNHVAAHVDRVSPLGLRPQRRSRYSLRRAAAHNAAGMAHDLLRLVRGRQGDHRSELDCEWIWKSSDNALEPGDLLDPKASAWSVQLEARVTGRLDDSRLRRAMSAALGPQASGHDALDVVECVDDGDLDSARVELQSLPLAVTECPPLRARLARHPGGDVLMLTFNHAAADGFDAIRVLRAIAHAYAGDADDLPALDFLATRDLPVRPASAPVAVWRGRYRFLVERLRDRLARPALLSREDATDEPGYGFHLVCLSAEDTRRVVDVDRPGTSRNVLMAALHLAIGDWNLKRGTPGRRIGVLVPVNLRPQEWRDAPVANFSVTARVSTSRRHRAGAGSALKAITAQTTRNKRTRTGVALLAALERSGLLPLWAKQSLVVLQPLTRNRLLDTALVSNLGWLEDAPSFGPDAGETEDLWYSTPARAPLTLCVGALTVAGRLHLVLRYPRRLFGADAARRFADCYIEHIQVVAPERRP
jgi:NRPS condensation-like uncharacterized protein